MQNQWFDFSSQYCSWARRHRGRH